MLGEQPGRQHFHPRRLRHNLLTMINLTGEGNVPCRRLSRQAQGGYSIHLSALGAFPAACVTTRPCSAASPASTSVRMQYLFGKNLGKTPNYPHRRTPFNRDQQFYK